MSVEMNSSESDKTPQFTSENASSQNIEAPTPRKRTKLYVIIALAAVLLLGGGGYLLLTLNGENDEKVAYRILENNDNPQDYKDFLEKYPQSPYAEEVRNRLSLLEAMIQRWGNIALSDNVADFVRFKTDFNNARYGRLCDIKIDSLDFIEAQRAGTEDAFAHYLSVHPDGRYASEASIAQGNLHNQEITPEEKEQIVAVISDFFHGFETRDETAICSNITATMENFLNEKEANKAAVVSKIKGMFNEHILDCRFVVNRDIEIIRQGTDGNGAVFIANFTIDQHIDRDNEGKTFGSYKCVARLTPQLLISSLTMQELSKQ